ncbi:polysaccharide biosynthesis C-terminal domain-containing protein [Lysinibacillus sp. MHQ-1]|nr:polysaccharide biosynthesis C-terminal domain-containing protein [Lysinibacillus sp. MHQ-1]
MLNVRLIGWLGVLGAAIANDIGLLVTAFLLIVYLKTITGIQLASKEFYKKSGARINKYGSGRISMATAGIGFF